MQINAFNIKKNISPALWNIEYNSEFIHMLKLFYLIVILNGIIDRFYYSYSIRLTIIGWTDFELVLNIQIWFKFCVKQLYANTWMWKNASEINIFKENEFEYSLDIFIFLLLCFENERSRKEIDRIYDMNIDFWLLNLCS